MSTASTLKQYFRILLLALLTALGLVGTVVLSSPAQAVPPPTLEPGQVIADESGVLSGGQKSDLEAALNKTVSDSGIRLHVVYVDYFEAPDDRAAWVAEFAQTNRLGESDALLAIATGQREYELYSASPRINGQLEDINSAYTSRGLAEASSDWSLAGQATAQGITDAADGQVDGTWKANSGSSSTPGFGMGILILPAIAVVAIVGIMVFRRKKSSQGQIASRGYPGAYPSQDPLDRLSVDELELQADQALLAADDAYHHSDEELNFALASYGEGAVAEYRDQLDRAQTDLQSAFSLKHEVDSAQEYPERFPLNEGEIRGRLKKILQISAALLQFKESQEQHFDQMRNMESKAEENLSMLTQHWNSLKPQVANSDAVWQELDARYTGNSVEEISDNARLANDGAHAVESGLQQIQDLIASGDRSQAVLKIRQTEDAISRVKELVGALSRAQERLPKVEDNVAEGLAQTEQDLSEARGYQSSNQGQQLAGIIAKTEAALAQVRERRAQPKRDPERSINQLTEVHMELSEQLNKVRDHQKQRDRAQQALQTTIRQAQAKIEGAADFIASRRGAIGSAPRTKLSEAERTLSQAIQDQNKDPIRALNLAQQASTLADRASQLAQSGMGDSGFGDFGNNSWTRPGGFGGYGFSGGRNSGGNLGSIATGMILGQILRGGSGSRSSRSSWGGGFGSGSSRRSSGGSFRGSRGSRGGRSSGGRF